MTLVSFLGDKKCPEISSEGVQYSTTLWIYERTRCIFQKNEFLTVCGVISQKNIHSNI